MKFSLTSFVAVLVAGTSIVSASPTLFNRQEDLCGKQCFYDEDCSGTCGWCSRPAQWGWKCVDFDPNGKAAEEHVAR